MSFDLSFTTDAPFLSNATVAIWRRTTGGNSSMARLYRDVLCRIYAPASSPDVTSRRFGTSAVFNILVGFNVDLRSNDQVTGYNPFGYEEEPTYTCRHVIVRGDGPLAHRQGYLVQVGRGAGQ